MPPRGTRSQPLAQLTPDEAQSLRQAQEIPLPGTPTRGLTYAPNLIEDEEAVSSGLSSPPELQFVKQDEFRGFKDTVLRAQETIRRDQLDMYRRMDARIVNLDVKFDRIERILLTLSSGAQPTPPTGDEDAEPPEETASERRMREGSQTRLRDARSTSEGAPSGSDSRAPSHTPVPPQSWGHPILSGTSHDTRAVKSTSQDARVPLPRDIPPHRSDFRQSELGPIRTGKPHSKEPDPFDGSHRELLPEFLFDLETIFTANNGTYHPSIPDSQTLMVKVAISHLRGIAKRWALSLVRIDSELLGSWELFRTALVDQFHDPNEKVKAHQSLVTIRNSGKLSSIGEYTIRFEELSSLSGIHPSVLRQYYWDGLSVRMSEALFRLDPERIATLAQLKSEAYRHEVRFHEQDLDAIRRAKRQEKDSDTRTPAAPAKATPATTSAAKTPVSQKETPTGKGVSTELTKYRRPGSNHKRPNKFNGCFQCKGDHFIRDCPQLASTPLNLISTEVMQQLAAETPEYEFYIAAMQDSPMDQAVEEEDEEEEEESEEEDDAVIQGKGKGRVVVA